MEPYILIPILFVIFCVVLCAFSITRAKTIRKHQLEREIQFIKGARSIRPNMTKENVINILGNRYTTSYLQDGVENLVWQYRKYKRIIVNDRHINTLAYTRKISVSFKNDIVIEVRSFNMD